MRINIIVGRLLPSGGNRNVINLAKALNEVAEVSISVLAEPLRREWIITNSLDISLLSPGEYPPVSDVYLATDFATWGYLKEIEVDRKFGYMQGRESEFFGDNTPTGRYANECLEPGDVTPIAIASGVAKWLEGKHGYDDVQVIGSRVNTNDFWREPWFPNTGKVRVVITGQYSHKANFAKDKRFMSFRAVDGLDIEIFHVSSDLSMFAEKAYAYWVSPRTYWLRRIYSSCDICVHATKMEGQPVVDQEMWACGVPLVRAITPGMGDEMLADGYNCLLADYGDDELFREHVIRLCDDASLRRKLARNGAEYVSRMESFDSIVGKWMDVFK